MVELIQQLLFSHNCVIVPGFGAFIGNYASAEIYLKEKKIMPPYKSIAFNRTLQNNDGILINAVAQLFNISYTEAESKVAEFAADCNNTLLQHGSLIFKNIGRLVADEQKNIRFQPYQSVNYLPQSYGLTTLTIEPIQRLKDEAKAIQESNPQISDKHQILGTSKKRSNKKVWSYGIAAVLAFALIVTSISWNIQNNNQNRSNASIMPSFDTTVKQDLSDTPTITPETTIVSTESKLNSTPEEIPAQESALPSPINTIVVPTTYQIVIGAFFDEERANLLKAEAESKHFTVDITKDSVYGIYRTTVIADSTEIGTILQKVKNDINPRAWVLYANKNR